MDKRLVPKNFATNVSGTSARNLAHTFSVTGHVCQQIKTDFPNVKNNYKKSDNAGCYAGNGLGEYHILKEKDLTLIRHGFNEPRRGKDQRDKRVCSCPTL